MRITLKRPKEKINLCCAYKIFVVNKEVATLKNNEEKTVEVDEDTIIYAKITGVRSNKFTVKQEDAEKNIMVKGNSALNRMSFFCSLFPIIAVLFIINQKNAILQNIGIFLMAVILFIFVFSFTIWRNKWLIIAREQKD